MMTNWKLESIRRSQVYTPVSQVIKSTTEKNQLALETISDNKKIETRIVISKNIDVADNPLRGGYVAVIKTYKLPKLTDCFAFSVCPGDGYRSCGSLSMA
jgi:hypothetical protein